MKLKPLVWAVAAATLSMAVTAHAADGGPDIKFSGYGTIAGSAMSESGLKLIRNKSQTKGVGTKLDIGSDSRFGLQTVVNFESGLSFTGQVEAERRVQSTVGNDKDFDPSVEWLYGQYQFLPSVNIRLGRVALPVYMLSDSLNVTYAQPWLRAPLHLYSTQGFNHIDGVQLNWRDTVGSFNLSAQLTHGTSTNTIGFTGGTNNLSADFDTAVLTAEHGDWLARAAYSKSKGAFGPFMITDKYTSVGLQYDNGTAVVMGEYAWRREPGQAALPGGVPLAKADYAYVGAGWRFGKLLPMLVVSKVRENVFGSHNVNEPAVALSLRYDVAPNVSLKAQAERYSANDATVFFSPASDSHKVQSYTVGLDFVF